MKKTTKLLAIWGLAYLSASSAYAKPPSFPKNRLISVRVWRGVAKDKDVEVSALSWSPNGKWAVYTIQESNDFKRDPDASPEFWNRFSLCCISRDGKTIKRLQTSRHIDPKYMGWSPDGKRFLYMDYYNPGVGMNAYGNPLYDVAIPSGAKRLCTPLSKEMRYSKSDDALAQEATIHFSRDGKHLFLVRGAYRWCVENSRIVKLEYATLKPQWLTPRDVAASYPVWSPDDKRIAYIANDDKKPASSNEQDHDNVPDRFAKQHLWVMNEDGTQMFQLTNDPKYHESFPKWRQNGLEIEFVRETNLEKDAKCSLWAIGVDGKGLQKLKDLPPDKAAWEK